MNPKNTWLPLIAFVGVACLGLGIYSITSKSEPNISQRPVSQSSHSVNSKPTCVITYSSGSCWTVSPPQEKCGNLPTSRPAVSINGNTCKIIVTPTEAGGVSAVDGAGNQFVIQKGDSLDIQSIGLVNFSKEHPCAPPDGVNGWYDPYADSPFTQNVGGLEFSIGSLTNKHYFAGSHTNIIAENSGVPVFRVIDRANGYSSNNSGAFTVTITKR